MTAQTKTRKKHETEAAPQRKGPEIRARRLEVDYPGASIPKHWALDDPFLTHWLNAYTMTIPGGEAMIVKTIQEFADKIEDPRLKKEAQGLIGQELSHSNGHLQFIELLQRQGYNTQSYTRLTDFISNKILEP
ncbi:MAG: metal-dependent hydrolase, partial [Leptospirales bacterium]